MTVLTKASLVFFLTVVVPATVEAAPSEVLGEGVSTCGDFIAQPNMQSVRLEWLMGYISGKDSESTDPKDRLTGHSIDNAQEPMLWLQDYCKANPAHPLIMAADHFRADLQHYEQR